MKRTIGVMFLITAVLICLSAPTFAGTKKSVFVCTKIVAKDYTGEDEETIECFMKYKKNGFLKKASLSYSDGIGSVKINYKYKHGRISKSKFKNLVLGSKIASGSSKYSYNKKVDLSKITRYSGKKKKTITKNTYNKNGLLISNGVYSAKGKRISFTTYKRDNNGRTIEEKTYSKSTLESVSIYSWIDNNRCEGKKYNSRGELQSTEISKYAHDNPIETIEYDENGNINNKINYYYKRITTKKAKTVNNQQYVLGYYLLFKD